MIMGLEVKLVETEEDLQRTFDIREAVFVREQHVDRSEEYDEFEEVSYHFLALVDGQPAGACRWRKTEEGVKLERFATLSGFRKKGVGAKLTEASISHISTQYPNENVKLYLNAQLTAMSLYAKFGFEAEGPHFMECNIEHQKMSRDLR